MLIGAGTRGPKGVTSVPFIDALLAGILGVVLGVLALGWLTPQVVRDAIG